MGKQAKDLKLEKDGARISQEKKEASSWIKQDLRIACKNFICSSFLNLKVCIFFVTLNKLNIVLELNFYLNQLIHAFFTALLV